jgi:hypothetical protein
MSVATNRGDVRVDLGLPCMLAIDRAASPFCLIFLI